MKMACFSLNYYYSPKYSYSNTKKFINQRPKSLKSNKYLNKLRHINKHVNACQNLHLKSIISLQKK